MQDPDACVTVTIFPPTVSVPVRVLVDELAATAIATTPLPLPELPFVTVIQAAPLTAPQEHPAEAVTVTDADPAVGPIDRAVLDRV